MTVDLSFLNAGLVLPAGYKEIQFWLVGAGGTGSFMAMNLARLCFELKFSGKAASIVIVDPDRVEEGNIPRSNFCFAEIGQNKAETLAGRIARAWGMEVGFVKEGFHPGLLNSPNDDWNRSYPASDELKILVGCVDNAAARKQMHEAVKLYNERGYNTSMAPRLWWIDGGNGHDSGQVLIGNRLSKKEIRESVLNAPVLSLLPAPSLQHPELLEPALKFLPHQAKSAPITCAERIRLGEQSLNINQRVAVEMSEILTELLLTHKLKRFAAYFDIEAGSSHSLFSTPEAITAVLSSSTETKKRRTKNETAGK